MKNSYGTVLLAGILLLTAARAAEIQVRLQNPPDTGSVVFVLDDSPNTFGDLRNPVMTVTESMDGRAVYSITNVPPGEYALLVYYDENGNARIDKNFIGIPREPLGFSNEYNPKGPPSYARAAFVLTDEKPREFNVELYRALGKRGRIGAGLGMIWRSSPYRGYDGGVYQFIPAITYTGNRLQWFGPQVQLGLVGSGKWRLAATGRYRMGPYEEDGSNYLAGMGDAEETFMAGLSVQLELPKGIDLSVGGSADVIKRIGGFEASAAVSKSFQLGIFRVSPGVAVNWLDREMTENDYGVPSDKAAPNRPAYSPNASFSVEGQLSLLCEITPEWLLVSSTGIEWLGEEATDSPLVEKEYLFKGYAGINYLF